MFQRRPGSPPAIGCITVVTNSLHNSSFWRRIFPQHGYWQLLNWLDSLPGRLSTIVIIIGNQTSKQLTSLSHAKMRELSECWGVWSARLLCWRCSDVSGVELLMNNHQSLKAEIDARAENFSICVNLGKDLLHRRHPRSDEVSLTLFVVIYCSVPQSPFDHIWAMICSRGNIARTGL